MTIQASITHRPAKRSRHATSEAGWFVTDTDTGKTLSKRAFATREDAEAALPGIVAQVQGRVDAHRAQQHDAQQTETATQSYTTVHGGLYGEGRRYDHTPGATQYDDGSGRYNVQIWDES